MVQGVGFRPFVCNAARGLALAGWVRNDADCVRIEVQGPMDRLERFLNDLQHRPPPAARIDACDLRWIPLADDAGCFLIVDSERSSEPRPTIPADLALCADCRAEIEQPGNRRHGYPFTNCTRCGPRWSIIEQLPYDRPRTAMRRFSMCDACRGEYTDLQDRRFHAQPIACPDCGPQLSLLDPAGQSRATRGEALAAAAEKVRGGQILALKGLGGFQLIVDATDDQSVRRLRARKQRPDKPFALLMADANEVRRHCALSEIEERLLASSAAPIVLLQRHLEPPSGLAIAPSVAPANPYLGVMLPCTPLHHLLLQRIGRPVVCTSGNLAEEPMATQTDEAVQRLGRIADAILTHDRPIVRPVDDSVVQLACDGPQILRRARGYAPLPIALPSAVPTILAVGGQLKNTVALSLGRQVILSPHIGDLDSVLGVEVHERVVRDLVSFFAVVPDAVACDLHPDYASTRLAERLAAEWDVPLVRVQHHHAHVAACAAEHGVEGPLLGLSWDGTGFGSDGTVWGGEVLACEGSGFTRLAHLRTFPLPGGDAAAREPRRSAWGLLHELLGPERAANRVRAWFTPPELRTLAAALQRPRLFPRTSSLGRLFDGVAALGGRPQRVSFEGQAAMELQFAVDPEVDDAYPLPLGEGGPAVFDWGPVIDGVLEDVDRGVSAGAVAARFHNALAAGAVAAASRFGMPTVALSGGCFQNGWLSQRVAGSLRARGFTVLMHRQVPPGDGGIALGQVLAAARLLEG